MSNQRLKIHFLLLYFVGYMKMVKKINLNQTLFFSLMNNFTLKVLCFSKNRQKFQFNIWNKFLVIHGSSIIARRGVQVGKMQLCSPKQRRRSWCIHHKLFKKFYFLNFSSRHSTFATEQFAHDASREALAPKAVKPGKMQKNDASVWCICREMKTLLL